MTVVGFVLQTRRRTPAAAGFACVFGGQNKFFFFPTQFTVGEEDYTEALLELNTKTQNIPNLL